jgi:hypothetical protein
MLEEPEQAMKSAMMASSYNDEWECWLGQQITVNHVRICTNITGHLI